MSDNIVLEHLRALRADVTALRQDVHDLRDNVTALGINVAAIRRDVATLGEADAQAQARFDRVDDRLGRIERQLDIVPAG